MTVTARLVLADAENAALRLTDRADAQWRIHWAAVTILIRAVGETLERIDEPARGPAFREAVHAARVRLFADRPPIYWYFIRDIRHNILNSYEFATRQAVERSAFRRGRGGPRPSGIGPIYPNSKISRGPFAGRTPLELIGDALAFWRDYLDLIDADVARRA